MGSVSCTVFTIVSCTLLLCNLATVSSALVLVHILRRGRTHACGCSPPHMCVRIGLLVHAVNAYVSSSVSNQSTIAEESFKI